MNQQVQKSIRFPAKAVAIIENEVRKKLGIDFNEFLKVFVINKADEIQRKRHITSELQAEIDAEKEKIRKGEKKVLRTDRDIEDHLNNLLDESE